MAIPPIPSYLSTAGEGACFTREAEIPETTEAFSSRIDRTAKRILAERISLLLSAKSFETLPFVKEDYHSEVVTTMRRLTEEDRVVFYRICADTERIKPSLEEQLDRHIRRTLRTHPVPLYTADDYQNVVTPTKSRSLRRTDHLVWPILPLDLSSRDLDELPPDFIKAARFGYLSYISTLDLSDNSFKRLPSLKTLGIESDTLDLRNNPDLNELPEINESTYVYAPAREAWKKRVHAVTLWAAWQAAADRRT